MTDRFFVNLIRKPIVTEFARYLLVGGTAFIVDFGTLVLFKQFILPDWNGLGLYIATALGFIAGLVYNYILSLVFVFTRAKGKGRSVGAFIVFAVIGLIGLALTELGMYIGVDLLKLYYMLVKVFVTAVVLIWNYAARKILIFKED